MQKSNNLTLLTIIMGTLFLNINTVLSVENGQGVRQLTENEVNPPIRISFQFIDQYGRSAEDIKAEVSWKPLIAEKESKGVPRFITDPGEKVNKLPITANKTGKLVYENTDACPGGMILIKDNRYIADGYVYQFALSEYFKNKTMYHIKDRGVHQFNPDNPEIIRVWRRIGFKPLVHYEGRNNEIDLISASGEVRFDLSTFQSVEDGGDIILKWEIGDTVPPDDVIVWIKRPEQWGRQLHYTITTVDGQMWPIVDGPDQKNWRSVHGILVDHMPPGQPACDVKTTLLPRGNPQEQRFMLMSRNAQLCAKVSLEFSLRDSVKGLIRVNFNDTVVNPSGPPSLEIQPSDERDNSEGEARQKMTIINKKLRSIGVGPLPNPGPTADVAWAAYEKACAERGIKPLPRPQGK